MAVTPAGHFGASTTRKIERGVGHERETHNNHHRLNVSVNTISFHMRRIYDKLQVHSKSEAVSKALRNRLVP